MNGVIRTKQALTIQRSKIADPQISRDSITNKQTAVFPSELQKQP